MMERFKDFHVFMGNFILAHVIANLTRTLPFFALLEQGTKGPLFLFASPIRSKVYLCLYFCQ